MSELIPSSLDIRRVRVQCRRGMLELDFLLERFLQNTYLHLSPAEQAAFLRLLSCSDPQLLDWLTGTKVPDDVELAALVLLFHSYNIS